MTRPERPDPKTASDEEVMNHVLEVMGPTLSTAASGMSVNRLLVAKGLVTVEELGDEHQAALAVLIEAQIRVFREIDIWDKTGDQKAAVILTEAAESYMRNGLPKGTAEVMEESIVG